MENLNQLIDRLTTMFLPVAVKNKSFFINEVPVDLPIDSNPQWIASVVSRMMSTVVNHVNDTCIRFTAKKQGYIIVFEILKSGSIDSYSMANELQQVNSLAEKIGGHLSITLPKPQTTSIAFTFPNIPSVAA